MANHLAGEGRWDVRLCCYLYCHKAGLVVEVDGGIHDLQQEEDARREKVLREMGLRVASFGNDEVKNHLSEVTGKIRELVA